MKTGKILFLSLIACVFCLQLRAQDPHFSQYFASPLTLNPANTGFFDGEYRIAINERQQWWNVGDNYNTTSISADVKLFSEQLPEDDVFALGFSGIFDKSLNAALQSNYFSLSGAYHKSLADEGTQTLGLGFQLSYADRYLDLNRLTFASQFNVDRFDPSISANTTYGSTSTKYLELNAGLLYAIHGERTNVYFGTSLYHTNRPPESLFDATGYRVPFRYTGHAGGEFNINQQSSVLFSGAYQAQGTIRDKLIGVAYGLKTNGEYTSATIAKLYFGLWYRIGESYIPYFGMDLNNFSAGLNYSMPAVSVGRYQPKTFEISLIYRHKSNLKQSKTCPRF